MVCPQKCSNCGKYYEYEIKNNMILFCSRFIYLGDNLIAMVDYGEESGNDKLSSQRYNLHLL